MKNITISLLSILIATIGIAFTKINDTRIIKNAENKRVPQWFYYIGATSPATETEAKKSTNYRRLTSSEVITTLCPGSVKLCAISAEANSFGFPDIYAQPIETAITAYFANPFSPPPSNIREKN